MPLFMDLHKIDNVTIQDVKKAHTADLAIQEMYGVRYLQFWVNEEAGTVFCLTEGPDKETCELVHKLAHGNIACALTEVEPGFYNLLMGTNSTVDKDGLVSNKDGSIDLGYRNILVASVRGLNEAGNAKDFPLLLPAWAVNVVEENIARFHGRKVNWATDDSIIGVFNDSVQAVSCAQQIEKEVRQESITEARVVFKIGISADQPVTKDGDLFSRAIKLAHRLSYAADDNQILISSLVRKLCKHHVINHPSVKFINPEEENFLFKVLELAEMNLANQDFTIDNICRHIGISRPQLYRKMTSLTGRAPNNFLRDIRMERALALLIQQQGNIAQVALEVGYSNPSYFARCFADKYGCTPSVVVASEKAELIRN